MWTRTDLEDGYESRTGSSGGSPGWTPDSAWSSAGGRRLSAVSDSGDTGIGTCCSDSVEDESSCTAPSFLPLSQLHLDPVLPVLPVLPSPSSSPGARLRVPARWARSPLGLLDMKEQPPLRRWSSLTRLSSDRRPSGPPSGPEGPGSLDRGVLSGYRKGSVDLFLPLASSFVGSSLLRSPGAGPSYRYDRSSRYPGLEPDRSLSSSRSSPVRHHLDVNFGARPEAQVSGLGVPLPPPDRTSPIQPAVRTQMWLTEQMEYRPGPERGAEIGTEPNQNQNQNLNLNQNQNLNQNPWQTGLQPEPGLNPVQSSLPVNSLVKVKEGLLRQKELEIHRQKQQILQLHARIRENELRAQQVLQNQRSWMDDLQMASSSQTCRSRPDHLLLLLQDPRTSCRPPSRSCCDEDLRGKLAVAEMEVLNLNEFSKQIHQKYSEEVRKLEEKVKTRDRYICSLKKKVQRETDQNLEKQQRIETLERYLSDLHTPEEVQEQQQQQQQVQQTVERLHDAVFRLQRSLDEGSAQMKQKELKMEAQRQREEQLMAAVHSLQQKVQQCLDDGVRLPVQDLKRLEVENSRLQQLKEHSSRLFKHQKDQIDRLTSQLKATNSRLQRQTSVPGLQEASLLLPLPQQPPEDEGASARPLPQLEMPELGRLLKEMSLCLLDLQGLCSLLAQRAQGKELNLTLLLGMKTLNVSAEDGDCEVEVVEEELRFKLLEVGQLRRDIDELRRNISDRYAQYMGDSCVSQ